MCQELPDSKIKKQCKSVTIQHGDCCRESANRKGTSRRKGSFFKGKVIFELTGGFLEDGGRKQTARDSFKEGRCGKNAHREGLDHLDPGVAFSYLELKVLRKGGLGSIALKLIDYTRLGFDTQHHK